MLAEVNGIRLLEQPAAFNAALLEFVGGLAR